MATKSEDVKKAASEILQAGKTEGEKVVAEVKKTAEKATAEVKKATTTAKKKATAAKKTATKKATAAKKTATATAKKATATAKKAATTAKKATTSKKTAVISNVYLQDNYGNSKTFADVESQAKAHFKETHKRVSVKSINIYVKAAENKIYYVVNDEIQGEMNLF